jgi:hypothetical protein
MRELMPDLRIFEKLKQRKGKPDIRLPESMRIGAGLRAT